VNGPVHLGRHDTTLVRGLANDVHDAAESGLADWNFDGITCRPTKEHE
jgi:hypothetical protein